MAVEIILIATLLAGVIIGYLAQRSRMCFVGGVRDYVLVKDTHLLKAPVAFLIGAVIIFLIASLVTTASPVGVWPWALANGLKAVPGAPVTSATGALTSILTPIGMSILFAVIGGLGVGLFSVFAGGCPLRQHVMASEGDKSSIGYLLGFYIGAVVFTAWIYPLIISL